MSADNTDNFNFFPFCYALHPDIEQKLTEAVKSGAIGDTRDVLSEIAYPPARLWTARRMRDVQDTVVAFIAMLSNTAVNAGMDRDEAVAMGTCYIHDVRKAKTCDSIKILINTIALNYTMKVGSCLSLENKPEAVKKVVSYIESHRYERISIEDLSKQLGYKESVLSMQFRRQTGLTLSGYIHRKKMELAAKELTDTDMKIDDIAQKYGYSNRQYFEIVFRKIRGMTPSEYRNSINRHRF
jgi:two-component system response regulator YesN